MIGSPTFLIGMKSKVAYFSMEEIMESMLSFMTQLEEFSQTTSEHHLAMLLSC